MISASSDTERVERVENMEEDIFRLGPDFNTENLGLKNVRLLSPFKTKPLLKDWYMVGGVSTMNT